MKLPITLKMSPLEYGTADNISIIGRDGAHLIDGCGCCGSPFTDDAEGLEAIVNAVNTHARLVEALEEVDSWDWEGLRANPWHVDWRSALEDIKRAGDALAAAKGGSHD